MMGQRHLTTRRGFVAAAGCGVVSLYALWADYGAAPLGFLASDEHAAPGAGGGHGGHGAGSALAPAEFRAQTERFVKTHQLADGSVQPALAGNEHAAHGGAEAAVDVYLMAYQWGYLPAVLRLDAHRLYRFRMMAVDVTHGASIQLGMASRIIRLRSQALVEQPLRFTEPGDYLVYCTVYCGLAHDRMQGKIIVA